MRRYLAVVFAVIPLLAACSSSEDAAPPTDPAATRRAEQARLQTWLAADIQLRKSMQACTHKPTSPAAGDCISEAATVFDEKTALFAEGTRESADVLTGQCGSALRQAANQHETLRELPPQLASALRDENDTLATSVAMRLARFTPRARKAVEFAARACG